MIFGTILYCTVLYGTFLYMHRQNMSTEISFGLYTVLIQIVPTIQKFNWKMEYSIKNYTKTTSSITDIIKLNRAFYIAQ